VATALGLNQLPSELLLMVLSQVPPRMLIRHCRQVCRRWRALVDCQDLTHLDLSSHPQRGLIWKRPGWILTQSSWARHRVPQFPHLYKTES
uniref:F-box domain-containing protein n=2 Tax=Sus scrofa TaxID=9823 RepID=A0A8D1AEZ5_PIG